MSVTTGESPVERAYLRMSTMNVNPPCEKETKYSGSILSKMRNTEFLTNALSVGSKNRLKRYQNNLAKSQGTEKPLFDDKLIDLLSEYVYDRQFLADTIEYLNSLRDSEGMLFSRDLKVYSSTQSAMERFSEPDHPSFRWNKNYIKSLKELEKEFSNFNLKPEKYSTDDDILQALPKTDTHSGYYYILSGKKEKGDNVAGLQAQLKNRKNLIRKDKDVERYPILIGFRTQASGEFEDDGTPTNQCKHKTRVVSMYDLRDIVLELQFANPVQKALADVDWYAGGKNDSKIGQILSDYAVRHEKFLSIDYSSYDQTISSWLIEDAFWLISKMFRLSAAQQKELDFICQNFIHKDFVLHEGVIHSDKGVPSGSMFTQIIDTIVNLLVVKTYFNSINQSSHMIAMGDDNAIYCRRDVKMEDLASYLMKNFGLIVKVDDKSNEGNSRRDNVKFLSRIWTHAGTYRHPAQLVSRMGFPERYRRYGDDVLPEHVLFGYILTYPAGMRQLMNVRKFIEEHPISASYVKENVDSRYIPGSLAYALEYTMK